MRIGVTGGVNVNPNYLDLAKERISNIPLLINVVSRRVRQLTSGGGSISRPLISDVANLGAADIALTEIAEGKMSFEMPEIIALVRPTGKNRKRPQHWAKSTSEGELAGRVSK